jgi:CHASE2 domain-containing sensor protein
MKNFLKYIFHIDHLLITLLAFAFVGLTYLVIINLSFMDPLAKALSNVSMTDYFSKLAHKNSDVSQDLTIVDIKDEFNRGNLARTLAKVDSLKPWATGVDIVFANMRGEPEDNLVLFETAMNMSENTVWATRLLDYNGEKSAFAGKRSSFFADTLGLREGFTNLDDNFEQNTIRKMLTMENVGDTPIKSFPVEIAATLDSLSLKAQTKLTINFATKFNVVPYDSIEQYKELITDHIVLVGSTTDEGDMWNSSIGKMPGVLLQAYSVETIRNHRDITYPSIWVSLLIAFVLCYIFELIVDSGTRWLRRRKDTFSFFCDESYFARQVVTIIFFAIVAWALAQIFALKSIYLNAVLILALLGFVLEARLYYNSTLKALARNHNWWLLKNSLINKK